MAKVGLRYPAIAKITGYDSTGMPTYGNGIYVGRAVKADISYSSEDASQYADDILVESDKSITEYSGSLEVDGFGTAQSGANETDLSVQAYMLGQEVETDEDGDEFTESLETTGGASPYHGFFYIKRHVKNGKTYWMVKHCYKACFEIPSESNSTKEKSTNYGTSTVNFTGMGINVVGKEDPVFTKDYLCDTLEKAVALLKKLAHIQDARN